LPPDNREPRVDGQSGANPALSPPDATIADIESAGAASLSQLGIQGSQWTTYLSEIEDPANTYVENLVAEAATSLSDDQIEKLCDRIRVRRQALPLSSSSREQILGISKQILAFGGAGLAAALATANNIRNAGETIQSILALVGILYLELTIVSLVVLIIYMLQARYRYPYLYLEKIGNAWPFFYYAFYMPGLPRVVGPGVNGPFSKHSWMSARDGSDRARASCLVAAAHRAVAPAILNPTDGSRAREM
jgi:hypothetical protein